MRDESVKYGVKYIYPRKSRYVFAKEPWVWYGRRYILVHIWMANHYCDIKNKRTGVIIKHQENCVLSIYCQSIDDFAMRYDIVVNNDNYEEVYNLTKKRLFDGMPDVVSMKWLNRHGFVQE